MNNESGLLQDVRVIDLTRILAGPYCTMMLGDLGADVIKIEEPNHGDDTRHWGPPFTEKGEAAYFLCANRNKRSITLNLKSDTGLTILKEIISQGDVLVENFKTGTLERWGLDYETLQKIRPGLVYCTVTGYGYTGPYSARPGYDFIIQAMGGFMSITGPTEGVPHRAGVAIADISAGMFAANAILAALYARERTGEGQRIDMALLDSQIALLTYAASNYFVSGEIPTRHGNAHPNVAPYESFSARDKPFAFAAGNDMQWKKFCHAVDRPNWIDDERFSSNSARVQNRQLLADTLNDLFEQRNADYWLSLCERIGLPAGPINTIDSVFDNPQVQSRKMRVDIKGSKGDTIPLLNWPLQIPTTPLSIRRPPPTLGEHTEEILSKILCYNKSHIASLRQEGVL